MKQFGAWNKLVVAGLLAGIFFSASNGLAAPREMKLKLNEPAAATEWKIGSDNTVKWSYRGELGATVQITLQRVGWLNARLNIVESVPIGNERSGSYKWVVPESLPPGGNYSIAVTAENGIGETSDAFSLVAGKTAVTQIVLDALPKGSEKLTIGALVPLRWSYSGNPGQTVQLALIDKTNIAVIPIVASIPIGVDGKGKYDWTVPSLKPGGEYYLAIASTTNAFYQDMSKAAFVILATK